MYLSSADGSKVFRVREEDDIIVSDEFVELDRTLGCVCLEIRSS